MNHLPFYVSAVFVLTTFATVYLFYRASNKNVRLLLIIAVWMIFQSLIAATGFFAVVDTVPPRLMILIALPLAGIATTFFTRKGRSLIDSFDIKTLTFLHTIRIAIEMVLFWLFINKTIPQLMTFEGRNFDLLSGISAPLVYYFGFVKRKLAPKQILVWNFICLAILLFTVSNAIFSAPTPFQKFAFDQPTIAVLYFPFVWLPGIVVPLVVFSHLITIRALMKQVKHKNDSSSFFMIKQVA
jgi:hypothetical protein